MRIEHVALAIAVLMLAPAAAGDPLSFAEFGSGDVERYGQHHDILDDARAPPMAQLGRDAVRRAEISWFQGHSASGWRRTRRIQFRISEAEYGTVAAKVDHFLVAGIADLQAQGQSSEIVACGDGPGYLTERIRENRASWFRPSCGGANDDIAQFLISWAFPHLG